MKCNCCLKLNVRNVRNDDDDPNFLILLKRNEAAPVLKIELCDDCFESFLKQYKVFANE